jgi:hypothetical protein
LQENLIGEYNKDYKNFSINKNDYINYLKNYDVLIKKLQLLNLKIIDYDVDRGLTSELQFLDILYGEKIKFEDAYNDELCRKHINNYDTVIKEIKK